MKWEYREQPLDPSSPIGWTEQLNQMGCDGWELVCVLPQHEGTWHQAISNALQIQTETPLINQNSGRDSARSPDPTHAGNVNPYTRATGHRTPR